MNKEVNFEIAKLLKDKGFDELCTYYYELEYAHLDPDNNIRVWDPRFKTKFKNSYQKWEKAAAPIIADVVMWIYEKYGVWITVTSISQESWQCHMTRKGDSLGKCYLEDFYNPTEAYEAGITYTLEHLI